MTDKATRLGESGFSYILRSLALGSLLTGCLALLVPGEQMSAVILRGAMILEIYVALLLMLVNRGRDQRLGNNGLAILGAFMTYVVVGRLVPALLGHNLNDGLDDVARQAVLLVYVWAVYSTTRRGTPRLLAVIAAATLVAINVVTVAQVLWFGMPTVSSAAAQLRDSKFQMFTFGVNYNVISYIQVLLLFLAFRSYSGVKSLVWAIPLSAFTFVSLVATWSRASLLAPVFGLILAWLWSRGYRRWLLVSAAVGAISVLTYLWPALSVPGAPAVITADELLSGRAMLWISGLEKFAKSPLWGSGPHTWNENLSLMSYNLTGLSGLGGGNHNAIVTVMAETGLLGLASGLTILYLLVRLVNARPASRLSLSSVVVWTVLVRSMVEQPGVLGYANSAVDYLVWFWIAVLMAEADRAHISERTRGQAGEPNYKRVKPHVLGVLR